MPRSNFSIYGLDIAKADRNLTYYYGLADFWSAIFEDSDKIDVLMEANSVKLSDIYSNFLQLTSTISIADINVATNQQIKLVLISEDDAVDGQLNTYNLSETILDSRLIVNRPLLPTGYYEDDIHYRIAEDGSSIQFFTGLSLMGFPSRTLPSGSKQYALWFVDTVVDEDALHDFYGKLIGVDSAPASEAYKSFIYGLYYLYTNGPNLALLRKGLNLVLGIPLARETETVLETRKYLETDQWLVITDLNSYLIPFGLEPTVAVGDVLNATDELAQWVEVKDWVNDGDWWLNLSIPIEILPFIPAGEPDRFAKPGTYADYVMRNYLYRHTFLVNIRTINFKNIQTFEQFSEIIREVKPTYTAPIYIWTVPIPEESVTFNDELFTKQWQQFRCENLSLPVEKLRRDITDTPLTRGCPQFTRYNIPFWPYALTGGYDLVNGSPRSYTSPDGPGGADITGTVSSYGNVMHQFRTNTDYEKGWLKTFYSRGQESYRTLRGSMIFNRDLTISDDSGTTVKKFVQPDPTQRVIFLFATTQMELQPKFNLVNVPLPGYSTWTWTLFSPNTVGGVIDGSGINTLGIDGSSNINYFPLLTAYYNTFFFRSANVYLENFMPLEGYRTWAPQPGDLQTNDYLLFIRVYNTVVGVYWVTSNQDVISPNYWMAKGTDPMVISTDTSAWNHGMGYYSGACYNRGGGSYGDAVNSGPITLDRSGKTIKLKREWA